MTTAEIQAALEAKTITVAEAMKLIAEQSKPTSKAPKTACPSRKAFLAGASPVSLPPEVKLDPREFSTGSFGWFGNGKVTLKLADGTPCYCQMTCSITVCGSKEAK